MRRFISAAAPLYKIMLQFRHKLLHFHFGSHIPGSFHYLSLFFFIHLRIDRQCFFI